MDVELSNSSLVLTDEDPRKVNITSGLRVITPDRNVHLTNSGIHRSTTVVAWRFALSNESLLNVLFNLRSI